MKTKSNTYLSIFFLALAFFLFPQGVAHADIASILYIQGPGGTVLVNTSLVVATTCNVQDSTGATHAFPGHKAVCALQSAKEAGIITSFAVTNWGFGFSLDSVNGIVNTPDWSQFWMLWKNGVLSDAGIQDIVLSSGDTFQLTYGPWITGIVQPTQDTRGGGPVVSGPVPAQFDVESAVLFLVKHQNEDGSFGSSALLTDWASIALGAYEGYSATAKTAKRKLKEHLLTDPSPGRFLTDRERRAMALQALSIDPYQGTKTNYIAQILKEFDGEQFGDANLVNDDIFALLVLRRAGYAQTEEIIQKTADFVFSWQKENGSWGTVDMTSAALQALTLAGASSDERILRARGYILSQEAPAGSFGNTYATSWAIQGLVALKEKIDVSWLASRQALDGGLEKGESKENRIWATSYAIPAALGKDWGKILTAFSKPQEEVSLLAEKIQEELTRVSQETAVLTLQVTSFVLESVAQQTAALQSRVLVFVESADARNLVSSFLETKFLSTFVPKAQALAKTAEPVVASSQLAASVGEATKTQLPWQNLVPYIVAGGVLLFLLFGNPNVILSFLQGRLSKVGRV